MRYTGLPKTLESVEIFATKEQLVSLARKLAKKAIDHACTVHDGKRPLIMPDEQAGWLSRLRVIDRAGHEPWNRGEEIAPLPSSADVVPIHDIERNLPPQITETFDTKTRGLAYRLIHDGAVVINGEQLLELSNMTREHRGRRIAEILADRTQYQVEGSRTVERQELDGEAV